MGITEVLVHDHEELRRQVTYLRRLLETACSCQPIQQRCRSLACLLAGHIAREETALAICGERVCADLQRRPHLDEVGLLHDVERLAACGRCPAYALALHLVPVIQALQEHMRQEEQELFPLVDQIEAELKGAARGEETSTLEQDAEGSRPVAISPDE